VINLTPFNAKVDATQCMHAPKPFVDALYFKKCGRSRNLV